MNLVNTRKVEPWAVLMRLSWNLIHYDPVHWSPVIACLASADLLHRFSMQAPELSHISVGLVGVYDHCQSVCFFIFDIGIRAFKIRVIF